MELFYSLIGVSVVLVDLSLGDPMVCDTYIFVRFCISHNFQ